MSLTRVFVAITVNCGDKVITGWFIKKRNFR